MKWLALAVLLAFPGMASAEGVICKKATCKATWVEPQTNADGSNLADLKEYRVYVERTSGGVAALATPTFVVPAPLLDPAPGATVVFTGIRSLAVGQWYMQVTAVDTGGLQAVRTAIVPFELQDDVPPAQSGIPIISD